MRVARPHVPCAASVYGVSAAVLMVASIPGAKAQADFQFRVNAALPALGFGFGQPSLGLATAAAERDLMTFVWSESFITPLILPLCPRTCDGFSITETFGGGQDQRVRLLSRRFSSSGAPLNGDVEVASTVAFPASARQQDGPLLMSSTSVRRAAPPAFAGPSAWRTVWWDQWSWIPQAPDAPCGVTCDAQPADWRTRLWPTFGADPGIVEPGECQGVVPSTAYSASRDIIAWRDILAPCRVLRYRINDTPAPGGLVLRAHAAGKDVDRPCAAAGLADRFVAAWREISLADQTSTTNVTRVDPPWVAPGAVVVVDASVGAGPAVAAFDDGSFAVQYIRPTSPTTSALLVQLFSAAEPPAAVGGPITIEPLYNAALRFTISVTGPGVNDASSRIGTAYEVGDPARGPIDIVGRQVRPVSRRVGAAVRIPDQTTPPTTVLGEMHQHTAALRSDGRLATTFVWSGDSSVYCSVRTLPPPTCPGDFNGDGMVNFQDLNLVLSGFGSTYTFADLNLVLSNFGGTC